MRMKRGGKRYEDRKETESQSGQTEIQLAAYVEAAVSAVDVGTFCHLAHHL